MLKQVLQSRYVKLWNKLNREVAYRAGLEYEMWPEEYERVTAEIESLRRQLRKLAVKIEQRS